MIVGTEWLIEAANCDAEKLRDVAALQNVFARVIADLALKIVGEQLWHKFPAPGAGVTGLVMLTESHLACHSYPEHKTATFNLYCCRTRAEWNWAENLKELVGAQNINVQKIERGNCNAGILPVVVNAGCVHPWIEVLTTNRVLAENEDMTAGCRQDAGVTIGRAS